MKRDTKQDEFNPRQEIVQNLLDLKDEALEGDVYMHPRAEDTEIEDPVANAIKITRVDTLLEVERTILRFCNTFRDVTSLCVTSTGPVDEEMYSIMVTQGPYGLPDSTTIAEIGIHKFVNKFEDGKELPVTVYVFQPRHWNLGRELDEMAIDIRYDALVQVPRKVADTVLFMLGGVTLDRAQ